VYSVPRLGFEPAYAVTEVTRLVRTELHFKVLIEETR